MSDSEASGDAAAQELANSLRKMGKLVTNLMARADAEPFREPGECCNFLHTLASVQ